MEILNIKDSGVKFRIKKVEVSYRVRISISQTGFLFYKLNWYQFKLNADELNNLISCLANGIEFAHKTSNFWKTNKIFIRQRENPSAPCQVKLSQRVFISSFNAISIKISEKIIAALTKICNETPRSKLRGIFTNRPVLL